MPGRRHADTRRPQTRAVRGGETIRRRSPASAAPELLEARSPTPPCRTRLVESLSRFCKTAGTGRAESYTGRLYCVARNRISTAYVRPKIRLTCCTVNCYTSVYTNG